MFLSTQLYSIYLSVSLYQPCIDDGLVASFNQVQTLVLHLKIYLYFMCLIACLNVCVPHACSTLGGLKTTGQAEGRKEREVRLGFGQRRDGQRFSGTVLP